MEKIQLILIIAAIIVGLIIIAITVNYLKKSKGRKGEKKVAALLKKSGKSRGCRLINNAYLPLYKGTCEVDHILIGDFGVLAVETKSVSGTISGSGKNLVHQSGNRTHTLYNPQFQNKTHVDNIIYHLQKAGIKNVPVSGIVVFSSDDVVLKSNVGIYLREVPRYIMGMRNAGCDTRKIYNAIQDVRVKNPLKKLAHDVKVGLKR